MERARPSLVSTSQAHPMVPPKPARTTGQLAGSTTPLHIAYAVEQGGGADTYAHEIAGGLVRRGHQVTILYIHQPGAVRPDPHDEGGLHIRHIGISNAHWYHQRAGRLLPSVLRTRLPLPDTVKALEASLALRRALHGVERQIAPLDLVEVFEAIAFPRLFRSIAPYAVKLHSAEFTWKFFCGEDLDEADRSRIELERDLLRGAALVTSPSAALADHVVRYCSYDRSRIGILPYPLDLCHFSPAPRSADQPDDTGHLSVLFVGRLVARKGLFTLVRAAARILEEVPRAQIEVVGGDTEEIRAESLQAQLPSHLRHRFVVHGRVPHDTLPSFYRRAAVCIVPSLWDNSPNTVYEAMGCGAPVVASDVGGVPELVADGRTGILVPADDALAFASAVISLLRNPELRETMGRAGRERAVRLFNPETLADETLVLYRGAIEGTASARRMVTAV